MTFRVLSIVLGLMLAIAGGANSQDRFASVLAGAGRPNAIKLTVPNDPCDALYSALSGRIREADLNFGPIALDQEAFFKHFCEEKKEEMIGYVRAPFDDAKGQIEGAIAREQAELTAGFWKFIAEQLYEVLPPEEQAKFQPGTPEMDELAHAWLSSAPDEVTAYAIAYLTAGGQNSRIVEAWKVYSDLTNGESKQILDGMNGVLETAKSRLAQITKATGDFETAAPDTPAADVLSGVGLSGDWVDRFKSYEGQLRALDSGWHITEAAGIMSAAMGSDDPAAKIGGFVELVRISGKIASESRVPILNLVGDIVQAYADVATEMLDQLNALENQIAKRNGFCLGVGAPSRDPRAEFFNTRGILACPLAYGTWPFEHIYQSQGAGPAQWFFYDGNGFITSENASGRDGVIASINLINAAIDLGYPVARDPRGHVARIGTVYNTSHAGGIPALIEEATEMVGEITGALDAARQLSAAGDACPIDAIMSEIADQAGLSLQNLERDLEQGSDRLSYAIAASFVAFEGGFGPGVRRGGAGYETYQRLAEELRDTSILIFEGQVLDENRKPAPGAILAIDVRGGREVRSCETWQADRNGRFTVTAVGFGAMAVSGQAETRDGRGPKETFDLDYFQTNAISRVNRRGAVTLRASGELSVPSGELEPSQACTELEAMNTQAAADLGAGTFGDLPELAREVLVRIAEIEITGRCPTDVMDHAVRMQNLLEQVTIELATVEFSLGSCNSDQLVNTRDRLRQMAGVNFSEQVEQIGTAIAGIGLSTSARESFARSDLDIAFTALNTANRALNRNDPTICPNIVAQNDAIIVEITRMRALDDAARTFIGQCNIDRLHELRGSIDPKSHPFYAVIFEVISDGLAACIVDQMAIERQAECAALYAILDDAREHYRANRLEDAKTQLRRLNKRVDGNPPEACAEISDRIARGAANIAVLEAEAARFQSARDACDLPRLAAQRDRSQGRNHMFFDIMIEQIDAAMTDCQAQSETVCEPLNAAIARVDTAFESGEWEEAESMANNAYSLIEGPESILGCEELEEQILVTSALLAVRLETLARVNLAVESCQTDTFGSLRDRLRRFSPSHARIDAAIARINEAELICTPDEPDDPPPPPVPEFDAAGSWRGQGTVVAHGESLPAEVRFSITGSEARGTFRLAISDDGPLNITGSFDGSRLRMQGRRSEDGATLTITITGQATEAGEFAGDVNMNFPNILCIMESLFEDNTPTCAQTDYGGTWRASR